MTILYNLGGDSDNALVISANNNLRKYNPFLINEFGAIGSSEWWEHFASGRITKKIVGSIASIAPEEDDDLGDAVTIQTSEGQIAYEYDGFWKSPEVKVGATVEIVRIESTVSTRTGPISTLIDIKIEIQNG